MMKAAPSDHKPRHDPPSVHSDRKSGFCQAPKIREGRRQYTPITGADLTLAQIDLDSLTDGVEQGLIPEWLREEVDSAGLHRFDRHRYISIGRQEYGRLRDAARVQLFLQIEPADAGHAYIEDEAARPIEGTKSSEELEIQLTFVRNSSRELKYHLACRRQIFLPISAIHEVVGK